MAQPPPQDNVSELSPLLKTRTPDTRDPHSMRHRKGFRTRNVPPGNRPVYRENARKR